MVYGGELPTPAMQNGTDVALIYAKPASKFSLWDLSAKAANLSHISGSEFGAMRRFMAVLFRGDQIKVTRVDAGRIVAGMVEKVSCGNRPEALFPEIAMGNNLTPMQYETAIAVRLERAIPNPASAIIVHRVRDAALNFGTASAGTELAIGMRSAELGVADGADKVIWHGEPPGGLSWCKSWGNAAPGSALSEWLIRQPLARSQYSTTRGA